MDGFGVDVIEMIAGIEFGLAVDIQCHPCHQWAEQEVGIGATG